MKGSIGEEFEGVISGVSTFGFWVETVLHKCEGLVSTTSLSEFDDFNFTPETFSLRGLRTGKIFQLGDKIQIKVVSANLAKRQLDYEWVGGEVKKPKKAASKKVNKKSGKN